MKKNVSQKLALIAFLLMLLSMMLAPLLNSGVIEIQPNDLMSSGALIMLFAIVFIYAKNESFVKFGYGLIAIQAFSSLGLLLSQKSISLNSLDKIIGLAVIALLLLSAIYYFVQVALAHFGYAKDHLEDPNNKVGQLKKWKKLLESNHITDADYDGVKKLVLNSKPSELANLNQMRELIDANLASSADLQPLLK